MHYAEYFSRIKVKNEKVVILQWPLSNYHPPSPSSLVATFFRNFFSSFKKSYFSLVPRPLPPTPPLSGRAANKNSFSLFVYGNGGIDEHVRSNLSHLICLRHFIKTKTNLNFVLQMRCSRIKEKSFFGEKTSDL